jgi:hypothetical protein
MPLTVPSPRLYLQTSPGVAYNTSTTLTDVSTNPQYVMPANTVTTAGQSLRMRAAGVWGNTGTPTLLLGFYKNTSTAPGATGVGGAALAASAAVTTTTAASNWVFVLEMEGTFTAVGTSGTIFCYGELRLATGATTQAMSVFPIPSTTPQTAVTFDTTKNTLLTVGAQWGTSSASNTLTLNQFSVEWIS